MRSFLVLLLLANLGYLAWRQGWMSERAAPIAANARAAFEPAAQNLTLLSELPAERRDLMASLSAAQASRAGAQGQLAAAQQQAAVVTAEIGDVEGELAESQTQSRQAQQDLLVTLDSAVAAPVEEAVSVPDPVPWCAVAGVFADQAAASAFVAGLAELGVEGTLELRQVPVSSTWWVHIPAFESEAAARALLAELQAKNIDSYYMRSGELAGGISLGVFSRAESAAIAQRQLAERGYTTSVREVFRMSERRYVALGMPDGALRQAPEWTAFLGRAGGVEVSENACETIASENEFP